MFKLEQKSLKKGHRITLSGELSIYTIRSIYDSLDPEIIFSKDLLINLKDINEFDSAGAQLLILLFRQSNEQGKSLKIEKLSKLVSDYFELFNLNQYFSLLDSSK